MSEIENVIDTRYSEYDRNVDFAINLGYQFDINCKQGNKYSANENIRRIAYILEKYLLSDRYKALTKIGGLVITPNVNDSNIKTGYLRYTCTLVPSQHTIYRRL